LKLKKLIGLLIIIVLLLGFSSSSIAEDEPQSVLTGDPISAGMPDIKEVYSKDFNDNVYITDYKENYSIDVNVGTFDVIDKMLTQVVNILFSLQRALVEALIFMFDKALSFSSYDLFDNILENFISGMYRSTFGVIAGILLACMGFYFFIKMIQQKQVEFWTGLAKTIVIIAIATLYFTNPLLLAGKVETASNEITKMVISSSNKKIPKYTEEVIEESRRKDKEKQTITIIANDLWSEYVHKPWRIMEFGNNEAANRVDENTGLKWEESVLQNPEGSDERESTIERMEDNTGVKTESMVTKRLGFMLMYLIPLTINILLMAIFCIAIIGLQFFVTLIFVLGVFVFIVALIPSFGIETVKRWGISIVFLSGMKIVLAFVLMVMLTFNRALYETASEENWGWIYALILQLAIYVVIYVFRDKIFNIFAVAKEIVVNPSKAIERIKRHGELSPLSNYGQKMAMRNPKNPRISAGSTYQGIKKGMRSYYKDWKTAKNQRVEIVEQKKKEYDDIVETEKSKKYLDKKYNLKKKKKKFKVEDMEFLSKVDNRVAKGKERWTDNEINEVKVRRKKAKEYVEYRKNREVGKIDNKNTNVSSFKIKKTNEQMYIPGGRTRAKKVRRHRDENKKN